MSKFLIVCGLLIASVVSDICADVTDLRVWTNKKDKKLNASLTKVFREKVKGELVVRAVLKLKNGKKVTVSVDQLAEVHQKEIAAWLRKNPTGTVPPKAPYSWPSSYNGTNNPRVEYVKFDDARKAHLYRTNHFDFYIDQKISNATVGKCVAVFDSIVEAIDSLPMEMDTIPRGERARYQAILVSSRARYMQMGGVPNSGGFFAPSRNLTVIPFSSLGIVQKGNKWVFDGKRRSFETLSHELTHHATNHWYGMPPWFEEGLAEYMSVMPYQSGRFLFTNPGSAVTSSIRKMKKYVVGGQLFNKGTYRMRHVGDLMATDRRQWNGSMGNQALSSQNYSSSMILVYYFMHEDGRGDGHHFIQWMHAWRKAVLSRRANEYDALIKKHLLRGRSYEQLEQDIQSKMLKKGLRLEF